MSRNPLVSAFVVVIAAATVVPAALFIAPQKASADSGLGCVVGLAAGLSEVTANSAMSVPVSSVPGDSGAVTSGVSTMANCLYDVIVVPLLRQMIRNFLKQTTDATISWINGNNGTGQPSYVQNLPKHLQGVGDATALPIIAQMKTAFGSPFDDTIASVLGTTYSQNTSMAGFYGANRCTLPGARKDQQAFLAGNWSQGGGVSSWFALTTQEQNNPYILFQSARSKLGSAVAQAQANRRQDLLQSGGFLSFCDSKTSVAGVIASPGVSCVNPDGSPGMVVTPGSAIMSYAQANINSGIGQLVSAQDLDSAIGQIVSALASKVLGPDGLFGVTQVFSGSSATAAVAATPQTQSSAAASAASMAQAMLSQVSAYSAAWNTIGSAANTASSSIASLQSVCATNAAVAQAQIKKDSQNATSLQTFIDAANAEIATAQNALSSEVQPVLSQVQTVPSIVASAQALATKIQAEANVVPLANPSLLSADVSTLASLQPSALDVVTAQSDAGATGAAVASPAGSLTVSRGTIVDRMNLISANAQALKTSVCTYKPPTSIFGTLGT